MKHSKTRGNVYRVLLSSGAYLNVTAPDGGDLVEFIRDARAHGYKFMLSTDIDSGGNVLLSLDHITLAHPVVSKPTRMFQLLTLLDQARRMREYLQEVAPLLDADAIRDLTEQFDRTIADWSTPDPNKAAPGEVEP